MREKTVFALGFFDGVHLGHQALLAACKDLASKLSCKAGVVTFTTHPLAVISGNAPKLINTPDDRKKLLAQFHMDTVVEIPFDREMMELPWTVFLARLQEEYNAVGFVCGEDFHFGYKGEGTPAHLQAFCKEKNFVCTVVPEQTKDGIVISSTYIRKLLEQGEMEKASAFLGHAHILSGRVIPGKHIGTTLGTPTANLEMPDGVAIPKHGVYACRCTVGEKVYPAVTNIGTRPTVNGEGVTVEAWLLDFAGDLYGKEMTLAFYDFLREEKKFISLEELGEEIRKNALQTRKLLEKY